MAGFTAHLCAYHSACSKAFRCSICRNQAVRLRKASLEPENHPAAHHQITNNSNLGVTSLSQNPIPQPRPHSTYPPPWRTNAANSSTCTSDQCFPDAFNLPKMPESLAHQLPESANWTVMHTATCRANAAPPTVSSKRKTTLACKSASAKSTRTAGTRARTRRMRCAGLSGAWARAMMR